MRPPSTMSLTDDSFDGTKPLLYFQVLRTNCWKTHEFELNPFCSIWANKTIGILSHENMPPLLPSSRKKNRWTNWQGAKFLGVRRNGARKTMSDVYIAYARLSKTKIAEQHRHTWTSVRVAWLLHTTAEVIHCCRYSDKVWAEKSGAMYLCNKKSSPNCSQGHSLEAVVCADAVALLHAAPRTTELLVFGH